MALELKTEWVVTIGKQGRVVIPAHVRDELMLREGDRLTMKRDGDRLVLIPQRAEVDRLRGMFSGHGNGRVVEDLIAERRREAHLERDR